MHNACEVEDLQLSTTDTLFSKTVQDRLIVFNRHFHKALQTTNRKSDIADRKILSFPMTLSDL